MLKLRFTPPEFQHRLVAEVWHYPDGSRVLELSTKTTPDDAFPLAARLRAFLGDHGVELTGSQQTKTRKALEFFAAALQGDSAEAPPTPAAAAPIVPRWEWRTFGASLQLPDVASEILEPGPVATSAEVYLLSKQGDASVKVRESILDVKRLEHVAENGLEQWRPVLKAPLPLSSEDAETVLEALGLSPDQVDGEPRNVDGLDRACSVVTTPRGARPQDAAALQGRGLQRRADDADGGRAHGGHDRDRIGGRRCGRGARRPARFFAAAEREHGAGAQGADRLRRSRATP